ncbi:MAG: hypothetical protein MI747_04685, partial [Desulfobacterales bacterium]|nr:hypothetical protein [Desulfobacterales bacterium]
YWILTFTYPNDQGIEASSRFFLEELDRFSLLSSESLSIVCHSMGGLVTRNLLSNPELAYEEKVLEGEVPEVGKVIMVGTPNHGSHMARFRFVVEFRDQLWHWQNTDASFLHAILDGAGQAGIDLLPGSRFLERLNSRPSSEDTEFYLIGGLIVPWYMADVKMLMGLTEPQRSGLHPQSHAFRGRVAGWTQSLGDGLVSISSLDLEGFPLFLVPGGHLDMVRNYPWQQGRTPPAVPVILELLRTRS